MVPETRYTRVEGINIAYQVVGDGPIDLVVVPGWVSNIEVFWEEPGVARFFQALASFSRLILFDKRGTGLSDRVVNVSTLEQRMSDVQAVLDAVGSQRSALLGYSEGGPMCALFAATYPERVIALIMIGSYATRLKAPDYPWGLDESRLAAIVEWLQANWGGPLDIENRAPSMANDMRFRHWWARYLRLSASPSAAVALIEANSKIDIRHVLPAIRVPTLVLHADKDRTIEAGCGRYLASHIPGAKLVEFDSEDHLPYCKDADLIVRHVQEFLTGVRPAEVGDRVLGTIMFEDIVDSTKLATERGDRHWADLLAAHNAAVRAELATFRGREVNTTGDGFVAMFDGPARAIRCAAAVRHAAEQLGLKIRAGLHTGECEVRDDAVSGLALHIAARVASAAPPEAIVVSRTVRDLVAGSDIAFEDFGIHALKGVPEQWQLFKARC